jgi:hypothetical protein
MSQRMVLFPKFAPDWEKAENELLTFPGGTHDDFVDALSKLGQGLGVMTRASVPVEHWGGVLPPWIPTLGWMKESVRARLRQSEYAMLDK